MSKGRRRGTECWGKSVAVILGAERELEGEEKEKEKGMVTKVNC